ncbi:MAG: hypothetical protein HOP10_08235 [Chitinophagaceae bacterium]|nr:hypothetical protein [Chitinophagaceae bacterium]
MSEENDQFISFHVGGKDEVLWKQLRHKLVQAINTFLDTVIEEETQSTIRQELKEFGTAILDYGKQKLKKAGIENDKILAEIELLFSEREKKNAETEAIKFETSLKKLIVAMAGTKVIMRGSAGKEELIFIKQIDDFLAILRDLHNNQKSLPH